jgi:hypothetical protein
MDFNEQHETGMGFQIFKFGAGFYVFDGEHFYDLININFSDLGDQTHKSNLISVESPFSADQR